MSFIVGRPFKGQWYYEIQICNLVLQLKHDPEHKPSDSPAKIVKIGNFQIWKDSCWKQHMLRPSDWLPRKLRKRYKIWRFKRRVDRAHKALDWLTKHKEERKG